MSRFLLGDELGNIKTIRSPGPSDAEKAASRTIYSGNVDGVSKNAIQALAVGPQSNGSQVVAAGFSDGSVSTFVLGNDDTLQADHKWMEARLRAGERYVGLKVSERGIFSCTSNGAMRLTSPNDSDPLLGSLPTRLHDWRLSSNEETFAYGGEEVDLSVWNTEMAFLPRSETQGIVYRKRKRNDTLMSGEVWRAKNVQNDSLGLRQPIRITSLTYLLPFSATYHLLTGTQLGDVRRYDTRSSRRPVSNWRIGKGAGISVVEQGISEHELFVGDHTCNLYAIDLRNGRVLYRYTGISGAVMSLAPSPSVLASSSLDRYARIHSFFPPPPPGEQQEHKGEVLEKIYMKSIPTVVVWDQNETSGVKSPPASNNDDDVWETMKRAY